MPNAPESMAGEDSVDDTILLDMDACFTAFDRDGYVDECVSFGFIEIWKK